MTLSRPALPLAVSFSGRMARGPYLRLLAVAICLFAVCSAALAHMLPATDRTLGLLILTAVFYLPVTAAGVRRLHDTGHDGTAMLNPLKPVATLYLAVAMMMALFALFPTVAWIALLYGAISGIAAILYGVALSVATAATLAYFSNTMGLLLLPSDIGTNRFGPNPHEVPR